MFYKHFEVYMYNREPVIVTGKSRSQVGRDFKRIYGHDAVDEVKPISGRSVESRYGFEYKQIVKANTMVNTPEGKTPFINEETMELKTYGFYEVKLVGTDETEIVIGSSLETVKAEMEEAFGDMLDSVKEVAGEELTSDDPTDPEKNHKMNVSILSGRNPFTESVEEMTGIAKAIMHPSATGKRTFADKKAKLKADLAAMKAKREKEITKEDVDNLNEISMDKLKSYHKKAIDHSISKGMGKTVTNDKGHRTYVPSSKADVAVSQKRAKGAGLAAKLMMKKRKQNNEEVEEVEEKRGLWDNIHAKRERIKNGSGEKMRKPGSEGAPSNKDLKDSQKEEADIINGLDEAETANYFDMSPEQQKQFLAKTSAKLQAISKAKTAAAYAKGMKGGTAIARNSANTGGSVNLQRNEEAETVKEDVLAEGADKLMYLARVGLMNKNELVLLRRAMSQKSAGQPISVQTRKILFKLLDKMVSLVIKNPHMFNQAKRKVMEDAWDEALGELQDKELTETFIQKIDYLREAGYMDPPKTKAEVKKKFPDVETDVKNKDSKEVQPVKYK